MLKRDEWLPLARKLDWEFSYVTEREVFPEDVSGTPWLPAREWRDWDEPYRITFRDYVTQQSDKDDAVYAVRDAMGKLDDYRRLAAPWVNGLKLHAATLPLAEFAAVIGNLRARALRPRRRVARDLHVRRARRGAPHAHPAATHARAVALGPAVRLDAQVLSLEQLGRDCRAAPGRRAARDQQSDRVRDRDQLRVRDRLHQPAVRRAVVAGARGRRRGVREDGQQHPERRGAPRADRQPGAAQGARARPSSTRSTCSTSGSGAAGCCSRSSPASAWTT